MIEEVKMHRQQRTALLVDGDHSRAERLAHRLAPLHFQVQFASDGATALLKAHSCRPDVVITAAELPVMDGYLLLEALQSKAETCRIPVILITEGSGQDELARGWKAGADMCVPRSNGEADVVATLHRALTSLVGHEHGQRAIALAS
jgi:PleD family two-component response regulator